MRKMSPADLCRGAMLVSALVFLASPPAEGEVVLSTVHDVDRLPNGNTLITDGGIVSPARGSRIIEVAPDGSLVAAWLLDLDWAHNADATGSGTVLISDTLHDRVVEVDASGAIVWSSDDVSPFSDGSTLDYPNDANLLASGNLLITDRNNHRVIEIDRLGTVVWQKGVTGVPGGAGSLLKGPHNGDRQAGGNTLIADSGNDRIIEVDSSGTIVWEYRPTGVDALDWPRDADRLDNGNTLITDSGNGRIIEVDPAGVIVWSLTGVANSYDADRLANGNTLVSDSSAKRVIEVDPSGTIVWQYPGTTPTTFSEVWIANSTSGVDLYTHVHRPADAGFGNTYPAIVLVPGGSGSGQSFHFEAERRAAEGFFVVHFDPDGRGSSTNGGTYTTEDYNGFIQQDGLKAVLDHVVALPGVDDDDVAIFSSSYGITMASGMLARYQDSPPVRYLIDVEGPADRHDTARANGGHVPVPPSDDLFWSEREASTFMEDILPQYVRLQTVVDHNPRITDNHHAIALINAGTNAAFGGSGISTWTRVNRDSDNPANQTWSVSAPAEWIPEVLGDDVDVIEILAMHERSAAPTMTVSGTLSRGGSADFDIDLGQAMSTRILYFALSYGDGPTVIPGFTTIHLDADSLLFATLYAGVLDGAGAFTLSLSLPDQPGVVGTYHAQVVYAHPGSATGYSASTGTSFEITN